MEKYSIFFESPIGIVEIFGTKLGVESVQFVAEIPENAQTNSSIKELNKCKKELLEYFDKKRTDFSVKLAPYGTKFQKKVWNELLKIPYGKTVSYLDIAKRLGDRNKIRAVGLANGKNPIAVIIPCHRVIGSDGKLVGYAGGLHRKKYLLEHEAPFVQSSLF